jgi:hypothetical protein
MSFAMTDFFFTVGENISLRYLLKVFSKDIYLGLLQMILTIWQYYS